MHIGQGDHADVPVWSSRGVSQMLRQDHPNGGQPTNVATAMRHLSSQSVAAEANIDGRTARWLRPFEQ